MYYADKRSTFSIIILIGLHLIPLVLNGMDTNLADLLMADKPREEIKTAIAFGLSVDVKDTEYGKAPLHWAVVRGDTQIVKMLLKKGAEIQVTDRRGYTPLHEALAVPFCTVAEDHEELRRTLVELLLQADADVTSKTRSYDFGSDYPGPPHAGETPLHIALRRKLTDCSFRLLDHKKCDLTQCDTQGKTPLHAAASTNNNMILQALLNKGADPNTQDHFGKSAMDYATKGYDFLSPNQDELKKVELFCAHGGYLDPENKSHLILLTSPYKGVKHGSLIQYGYLLRSEQLRVTQARKRIGEFYVMLALIGKQNPRLKDGLNNRHLHAEILLFDTELAEDVAIILLDEIQQGRYWNIPLLTQAQDKAVDYCVSLLKSKLCHPERKSCYSDEYRPTSNILHRVRQTLLDLGESPDHYLPQEKAQKKPILDSLLDEERCDAEIKPLIKQGIIDRIEQIKKLKSTP